LIDDPPLLTIRRNFPRPSPDLVAAFVGAMTGHVVDAMAGRGCLDYRIKPVDAARSAFAGVAVTCHCGPADNLALFGALDAARPGDILVAATDEFTATSITGDLLLGMAKNRGVAGFVTDGMVRDLVGVLAVGLPVFCAGLTANSPARNGPGTVGLPVVLGGVTIASGDILVGDRDGVVVVRQAEAAAVLKQLEAVRAAEAAMEAKVKAGLEVPDFVRTILASDRVRELSERESE
jgi:4-hydroxy-4-methyl-2-oxoglutarate aldolase